MKNRSFYCQDVGKENGGKDILSMGRVNKTGCILRQEYGRAERLGSKEAGAFPAFSFGSHDRFFAF